MAGRPAFRAVQADAGEREPVRRRVRLALAQQVGRRDRRGQQVPAARNAHRSAPRRDGMAPVMRASAAQLRRILSVVWAERRLYLPGTFFVFISIGTGLAYPYVIRLIIDDGVGGGHAQTLNRLAAILVGILLVEAVATFVRDYCFNFGAERVAARLRQMVFRALLTQDVQFFDRRDTGEITTRLWADVPALQHLLGEEFADAIRFSAIALFGTGLLLYTSPPLTLLALLAMPPIVIATSVLGRRVRARSSSRGARSLPPRRLAACRSSPASARRCSPSGSAAT